MFDSEDVLLFFRVITKFNPFVVMKDEFIYLNGVCYLLSDSGFDCVPG